MMTIRKTILFIENDENFSNPCADLLEQEGYRVVQATRIDQAEQILETTQIHLAIVDIRMIDDKDDADKSGLILASKREYKHLPKIILTAFPSFEYVREALGPFIEGIPAAVDFINKKEAAKNLIPAVAKAFQEKVLIHWDLDIRLAGDTRALPQLVSLIEPTLEAELIGERSAEIEDLLRQVFFDYEQVTISRILWIKAGRIALEIYAFQQQEPGERYEKRYTEDQYTMTIGLKSKIAEEQEKFQSYAPKAFTDTALAASAETFHYGGAAWISYGTDLGLCISLKDFLLRERMERQVKAAIENLYLKKLPIWHGQRRSLMEAGTAAQLMSKITSQSFNLLSERWQIWLDDLAQDSLLRNIAELEIKEKQIICRVPNRKEITLVYPELLAKSPLVVDKVIQGVMLGGLETGTILIDDHEQTWLTDFFQLKEAPLFLDFISLETDARFGLLESTNIHSIHQLEEQLFKASTLRDSAGSVEPDCKRIFSVIQTIRQCAAEVCGEELWPYYWGLLALTLREIVRYDPLHQRTKREIIGALHRLMVVCMLYSKLSNHTVLQGDAARQPVEEGITIAGDDNWVIVDGRKVFLTPTEQELLTYLFERANNLCMREDIIKDVFKLDRSFGDAEYKMLNTHMGRLRPKIEVNTSNPKYLHTVRGKGYKLVVPR